MTHRAQQEPLHAAAMNAHWVPAAIYLSLALFPDWWGDEGRARLFFQFYMVELCGGMLVGAVGKLIVHRSRRFAAFGAGLILFSCLAGIVLIGWTTENLALTSLVAVPLLPRIISAVQLARSGPWMGAMLLREGVISLAGCTLIGLSYLFLMSAGPDDPPNARTMPPPVWFTAGAMAIYYLVLGRYAGSTRGLEDWVRPESTREPLNQLDGRDRD